MPTKKKRVLHLAENLPSQVTEEEICPQVITAKKLKEERPQVYSRVVLALVEGMSINQIKKKFKVSHNILAVVRNREEEIIKTSREVLKGLTGIAGQSTLEKYLERLEADKIPDGVLPIAAGIFLDKVARDAGEATQTIAVKKTISLDQVQAELANMRKAEPVEIEAERIEERVEVEPEGSKSA